ncbi:translocation/assembly module TamB domain-containing protein [Zeimonas arvi]|uniref:Translocation and assembly module TamB C-terminal domain-containing protein n=1 Tax=Zeimonas arvi TaxID=2498847 RepID=A0A5C8P4U5_9BURK|nr:translocation/assembly module TamB domain-containing protein [Zeimonas arvi]TXL68662.1 hypothetical protein FHP08_02990 [Zeimonas arvi]
MRLRRLIGWAAGALLALLLLAAAAGAWWVGQTTSFVRWALAQAETAAGGALRSGEARGTLLSGVELARMTWEQAGTRVEITGLRLGWRPVALLSGELRLSELRAARVAVTLGPGGEGGPPVLPERIALPMKVAVDELEVGELSVRGEGFSMPAIRGLLAGLRIDDQALRLPRLAASVDGWGALSAEAHAAVASPFQTALAARIEPAIPGYPLLPPLQLDANGPIETLAARLRMLAPPGKASLGEPGPGAPAWATLETTVRPLSPLPVQALTLSLDGFEPDAIGLPGPRARLSGRLELAAESASEAASLAEVAWRGRLALRNALPGPVDTGLLPFASLDTALRWADRRLALDDIDLDGGMLRGEILVDTAVSRPLFGVELPAIAARLALRGLDPAKAHRQAWPARLGGEIALDAGRLEFSLTDADRRNLSLAGAAILQGERLRIASSKLRTPSGSIDVAGSARWQAPWQIDLEGRFAGLDPARLAAIAGVELPAQVAALSGLAGDWAAKGEVAPVLALDSRLRITEGRFDDRPLRVDWQGRVSPDRVTGAALVASLGELSARLAGDAGRDGDRLSLRLRLPSLAAVGTALPLALGLEGALTAEGEVSVPGFDAAALERSQVVLRIDARGLRHPAATVERARITVEGTLGAHRMAFDLGRAQVGSTRVAGSLVASGGLALPGLAAGQPGRSAGQAGGDARATGASPAWRWEGRIDRLATELPLAVALAAPMPLAVEPGSVRAGPGSLRADGGRLDIADFALREGRIELAGEAQALPVSRWAERFGLIPRDAATIDEVRLGGRWTLAGTSVDDLDGALQLRVSTTERLDAGGQADLRLQRGALSGRVDLVLPSLAVANRMIGPEWAVAGRLRVAADLSGTLREPGFAGTLEGRELAMIQRRLGWRLGDGVLDARFDGDRLEVKTLRLASGEGSVTLSGTLLLEGARGDFRLLADRLPVPIGPGQRIVVSGDTRIESRAAELQWTGKIRADEGLIELRGGEAPSLPGDVVIVDASAPPAPRGAGAAGSAAAQSGPAQSESALRLGADLEVDLGERIRVRGSGVDARLAGTLRLRGTLPDAPRATGTVRIRDGTYTAYGQKLEISRGRVIFNGPLDNPVLDITAMRRGPAVEAGVAVTGTVLSPRVKLVSEPEVPDSQKLSWLVLGVGPEDARTGGQVAALQAAAATLFGGEGGGLVSGIQESLGLDVLTIRNAAASGFDANFGASFPGQAGTGSAPATGATQDVVAIGKRLGSRMLITYEQGLRGIWSLLRFQYDITRRLSVRAQTGTDTAVDLLYFYSFD